MARGREPNHPYGALAESETLNGLLESVTANHDTNLTAHELATAAHAQASRSQRMGILETGHYGNPLNMRTDTGLATYFNVGALDRASGVATWKCRCTRVLGVRYW
jgi:hypothetical protein